MTFDPEQPVFAIQPIPYGDGSVYPASDFPLRLSQIPKRYQNETFLTQNTPKDSPGFTTQPLGNRTPNAKNIVDVSPMEEKGIPPRSIEEKKTTTKKRPAIEKT